MYGAGVVFGERVVLLDDPPARLPGPVLLPPGSARRGAPSSPRGSAAAPESGPAAWESAAWESAAWESGGVWLPGRDDTVRGRAARSTRPEADRRRAEAEHALGVWPRAQDEADVATAGRLLPSERGELRHAAATLDLATWRYKVQQCPPGPRLAALLEQRPGELQPRPGEGGVFGAECDGIPGGAVPDDERWPDAVLASLVARAKLIAHLQAGQYADIAELSACYPGIHQFLATELAAALHTTDAQAASLLDAAEALRDRLPDTRRALASGEIDDAKAMALVNGTAGSDRTVARTAEQTVLPGAGQVTATAVRRRTSRAVMAADPDGTADRHRRARKERHVYRHPEEDGMARLGVYAPAQDVATIWEAVTAVADTIRDPGDSRTLGRRRTDALVMICSDILSGGGWSGLRLPDRGLGRPRVSVTVPYTVLLGHRAPCELAGHGPITTEQALPLIGAGELFRMICDPVDGRLLDYGRTRYEPPPHLAEFVRMRDGECPMPTCHQPAVRGQLDHIVPAKPDAVTGKPTYGTTCADNLAPPCRHHHLSKDAGRGFSLHRALDGRYTWTTPLGRIYTWRPDPLWHRQTDDVPPGRVPLGGSGRNIGDGSNLDRRNPVGDAAGGSGASPRSCTCLPSTGPAGTQTAGAAGRTANRRVPRPTVGPGPEATPVCECPARCPCQLGPELDPSEALEPLTVDDDWADGFRLRAGRATAGARKAAPAHGSTAAPAPAHGRITAPDAPTVPADRTPGDAEDPPPF